MIKVTDEMVRAFNDADFGGLGNADWEDSHVRVGLAAVLAAVERDHEVRPYCNAVLMPGVTCKLSSYITHDEHKGTMPTGSAVRWS